MLFIRNLVQDVKGGRESWRVLISASTLSLIVAVAMAAGRQPF